MVEVTIMERVKAIGWVVKACLLLNYLHGVRKIVCDINFWRLTFMPFLCFVDAGHQFILKMNIPSTLIEP